MHGGAAGDDQQDCWSRRHAPPRPNVDLSPKIRACSTAFSVTPLCPEGASSRRLTKLVPLSHVGGLRLCQVRLAFAFVAASSSLSSHSSASLSKLAMSSLIAKCLTKGLILPRSKNNCIWEARHAQMPTPDEGARNAIAQGLAQDSRTLRKSIWMSVDERFCSINAVDQFLD